MEMIYEIQEHLCLNRADSETQEVLNILTRQLALLEQLGSEYVERKSVEIVADGCPAGLAELHKAQTIQVTSDYTLRMEGKALEENAGPFALLGYLEDCEEGLEHMEYASAVCACEAEISNALAVWQREEDGTGSLMPRGYIPVEKLPEDGLWRCPGGNLIFRQKVENISDMDTLRKTVTELAPFTKDKKAALWELGEECGVLLPLEPIKAQDLERFVTQVDRMVKLVQNADGMSVGLTDIGGPKLRLLRLRFGAKGAVDMSMAEE